jgi:hypothetical protein
VAASWAGCSPVRLPSRTRDLGALWRALRRWPARQRAVLQAGEASGGRVRVRVWVWVWVRVRVRVRAGGTNRARVSNCGSAKGWRRKGVGHGRQANCASVALAEAMFDVSSTLQLKSWCVCVCVCVCQARQARGRASMDIESLWSGVCVCVKHGWREAVPRIL